MGQGTELDRLFFTVDADTSPAKKKFADLEGGAEQSGNAISKHLENAGKGGEKLGRGIEVSRRELLYLGREVATGDLARLPSTLALITSHLTGMTSAGILAGGAIAAPFALIGIAAFQSEKAMNNLENAIRRTGAAAGVSPGALFQAITASGGGNASINQAAALLGRGNISNANLQGAMQASSLYGDANGMSRTKAAEDFEKILADPKKGAEELHDSMKLLTSQQIEQIDHLQRLGDKEDAQKIIIDATKDRLKDLGDQAGPVAKFFGQIADKGASWWAQFGHAVAIDTGISAETPEDRLSRLGTLLSQHRQNPLFTAPLGSSWDDISKQYSAAFSQKQGLDRTGVETQRNAIADDLRKQAMDHARALDPRYGRAENLNDDITLQGRAIANARGALADPRTSGSARTGFMSDIKEYTRMIAADRYGLRTGKPPSDFLDPNHEDPAARRLKEVLAATTGANSVADAYGRSTAAGRAATIQARVNQEISGLKPGEAPEGYADLLTKKYTSEEARSHAQSTSETLDKLRDENGILEKHTQMMGADEDARNRALALQEATNRVTEEYGTLNSDVAKRALAETLALTNAKEDQLKLLKDINTEQQNEAGLVKDGMGSLSGVFDKLNQGGNALKQIFPDLEHSIEKMIEQLLILNPLENALTGVATGTPGTLRTGTDLANLIGKFTGGGGTFGSSTSVGGSTGILGALLGGGGGMSQAGKGGGLMAGAGNLFSSVASWIGNLFANGGAWGAGGVRYAADGMVLGGSTMFHTSTGPVIGGEKGMNSEALVPLARGPDGKLGVRSHGGSARGHTYINQQISIHPDVSAIARGEVMNMMPVLKTSAVEAVNEAAARGVPIGGG